MTFIAIPYVHNDPERWTLILDKCCEHRPWFDDFTWEDLSIRRESASKYLIDAFMNGRLLEVWDGANLKGVLVLNQVRWKTDALCHFVFFDHHLHDKWELCLSAMQWAFDQLELHRLSVEVPTYARILARFARKRLGFRYEAEERQPTWPGSARPLSARLAELGSRRHQATLYKGEWHDVLLLSITREEFDQWVASPDRESTAPTSTPQPSQG